MKTSRIWMAAIALSLLGGCASYVTPGGPADFTTFTDPDLKKSFTARPAATFPANIAIVRIQQSGYRSQTQSGYGSGLYSVLTTRDVETDEDIRRIANLPNVADVVTLNRLLLPGSLQSDLDIRNAAAKLHTDVVLLYTLDTNFRDRDLLPPLSVISLGAAQTKSYHVTSTAAALLMDTRTGYIYGAIEEQGTKEGIAVGWGNADAIDAARLKSERIAFDNLLTSFESLWKRIQDKHS